MAITSTTGGSGSYTHTGSGASYTLFTTPATTNAIFIVYISQYDSVGNTQVAESRKLIVGPSTPVRVNDDTSLTNNVTIWHYAGMVIT
jgi:hypothetical protein